MEKITHYAQFSIRVNKKVTWKHSGKDSTLVSVLYSAKGTELLYLFMQQDHMHAVPGKHFSFVQPFDLTFKELDFDPVSADEEKKHQAIEKACKLIQHSFFEKVKEAFEEMF